MTESLTTNWLPNSLNGIAQRVEAASAGPWLVADDEAGCPLVYREATEGPQVLARNLTEADAQFLGTARERMPQLLAEVERLRAELATRPTRAEVLREAITAVEDTEQRRATGFGRVSWVSACGVLYRLLRAAEAGESKPSARDELPAGEDDLPF